MTSVGLGAEAGLVAELDAYWSMMQSEPQISGMFPWHWHYYNTTDPGSKGSYYCKCEPHDIRRILITAQSQRKRCQQMRWASSNSRSW